MRKTPLLQALKLDYNHQVKHSTIRSTHPSLQHSPIMTRDAHCNQTSENIGEILESFDGTLSGTAYKSTSLAIAARPGHTKGAGTTRYVASAKTTAI
jgi:hypothetical protein